MVAGAQTALVNPQPESKQVNLSPDGGYVAFTQTAGTTPTQIYKKNLATGQVTLVSKDVLGLPGDASSFNPKISSGGRYVTFSSDANNLAGLANGVRDVFLADTLLGTITVVSVSSSGGASDGTSDSAAMSVVNGNVRVVFRSLASNIVVSDSTGAPVNGTHIYCRDITSGQTVLVSASPTGVQGNGASGLTQPTISSDGNVVGFGSSATNLVANDPNGTVFDVFTHNLTTGQNVLVSLTTTGLPGWQGSYSPKLNSDGSIVAFVSNQGFVNGDTNGTYDVFVKNIPANTIVRASVATGKSGAQGNGASGDPSAGGGWDIDLSDNGNVVSFQTLATNFGRDKNGVSDIYVRDIAKGTTTVWSVTWKGAEANGSSISPSMGADGSKIAFISTSTNLVSTATPSGLSNAFVR